VVMANCPVRRCTIVRVSLHKSYTLSLLKPKLVEANVCKHTKLVMILVISTLIGFVLARPVLADQPQVRSVIVYSDGGRTLLNMTIYHNTEIPSHYVNNIQVIIGSNTTTWNISPQTLASDLTFNITYDAGVVAGSPTATIRAHCNIHGNSSDWSGVIPEFPIPTILLMLVIILFSFSTFVLRRIRLNS
jgi:hypothetical protein